MAPPSKTYCKYRVQGSVIETLTKKVNKSIFDECKCLHVLICFVWKDKRPINAQNQELKYPKSQSTDDSFLLCM